jgi:Transglutaminase-like superfamily
MEVTAMKVQASEGRAGLKPAVRLVSCVFLLLLGVAVSALKAEGPPPPPPPPKPLPTSDDAYVLAVRPSQKVVADFSIRYELPDVQIDQWCLVAAKPPQLPGQRQVSVSMSPAGQEIVEASPEKRRLIRAIVAGQGKAQHVTELKLHCQAVLYSRELLVREPGKNTAGPADLAAAERASYLRETRSLDYKSATFAKWLDRAGLRRGRAEGDIAFARRTMAKIYENEVKYSYVTGNSKASETVQKHKGDCVALAQVYVSVLRANGIPARTLLGRWAESAKPTDQIEGQPWYQTHSKAELFVRHVGWVPADPTNGELGKDDGDFIAFHVDPDIDMPTGISGTQPFAALMPDAYWVTFAAGKQLGRSISHEQWIVRSEQLAKQKPAAPNIRTSELALPRQ